jgi:hypothetical protein
MTDKMTETAILVENEPPKVGPQPCDHEGEHVIDFHGATIRGGQLVLPGPGYVVRNGIFISAARTDQAYAYSRVLDLIDKQREGQ